MSASVGKEENVVVVAVRAEREISKAALAWALTHIVRPGDVVTLLAVLSDDEGRGGTLHPPGSSFFQPPLSSPTRLHIGWRRWLWGFPKFSRDAGGQQRQGCRISASCSQMSLQIDGQNQVNVRIKVVGSGVEASSSTGGVVAAESKRVGANWIVLDKQLKLEVKQCLEEVQCNIVVMRGSRAKVLRLNLGSAPCGEHHRKTSSGHIVRASSLGEKGVSGMSSSTIGHGGGASVVFVHERNPLFDGLNHSGRKLSSKEDADSEEGTPGSDCSRGRSPAGAAAVEFGLEPTIRRRRRTHFYNHPRDYINGFHEEIRAAGSYPSPPPSSAHEHDVYWIPQNHISVEAPSGGGTGHPPTMGTGRTLGEELHAVKDYSAYTSEVREAVSLFGSSPSNPPPLCSLCRHKAPIFGKPPRRFKYGELEEATDGFSDGNFLGEGGHGRVHRGVLEDGQVVAVKQLTAGGDARDFLSELESLSRAQHRNAVMMVGFCVEGMKRVLVYEYICNGSLDLHLHGREKAALDWDARVKIAVGAARGLRYLHEDCRVGLVVHGDIRPNNILLTHDFEPMVGDFSLARRRRERERERERERGSTSVVDVHAAAITFGYLAPEYIEYGVLTDKADVYAFGVVLLELLTGRRSMDTAHPKGQQLLTDWARPLLLSLASEEGRTVAVDRFLDPRLDRDQAGRYFSSQLRDMSCAASMCLRRDPHARPGMSKVLRVLEGDVDFLDLGLDDLNSVGSKSSRISHHLIRHYHEEEEREEEEEEESATTLGGSLSFRFPHEAAVGALYAERSRSHFY